MRGLKLVKEVIGHIVEQVLVARSAPPMRGLKRGVAECAGSLDVSVARSAPPMRGLKRGVAECAGSLDVSVARSAPPMRGLKQVVVLRRLGVFFGRSRDPPRL